MHQIKVYLDREKRDNYFYASQVVAVLKLAIIITLFVDAIQWQQRFDKTEKYDNSYVEQFRK